MADNRPVSFFTQTINDNTVKPNGEPESAVWSVALITLNDLNVNDQIVLVSNLDNALAALGLGVRAKSELVFERDVRATTPATSSLAQRENKLLLRYHDATTFSKFRMSYPCFDLSKLAPHSEFVDLSAGLGATLKTAFEGVVVSPDDETHSVILDSAQFVGRNS